jgi:hypothetical protein
LPCGLARRIDIKDDVTTTLTIENPANGFRCPPFWEALLFKERTEGF